MIFGRPLCFDGDVGLLSIAVELYVGDLLFDGVGLTLGVHSLFVDNDEQVNVTRSVSGSSRDAAEEDHADVVANPVLETGEDRSDRWVILRLWNGRYLVVGIDEHLCVHPNSIRSAGSVDGDHAKCLEGIDGGIHTTQSFVGLHRPNNRS